MATNLYFNNFPVNQVTNEQLLVEDLMIEAMKIYGIDVYYLPRTTDNSSIDKLYGEDQLKKYVTAYPIEMYINNVSGMEGEGDFISKFGLDIRDEMTMLVSRRRFKASVPGLFRAQEGDLIYIPLVQNFFEIAHVEHENTPAMFYPLGRGRDNNVYLYSLKLRQFVFSSEIIETGIEEVDEQIRHNYTVTTLTVNAGGSGNFDAANNETVYQGSNVATATAFAECTSFNSTTRKLEVIKINGTFVSSQAVKGATSNASWILSTSGESKAQDLDFSFEDIADNKIVQTEGDNIIDFSENNPFGEP
jgi:hypothetical protein